jgi:phospholipase/lecithinase/hemolysin
MTMGLLSMPRRIRGNRQARVIRAARFMLSALLVHGAFAFFQVHAQNYSAVYAFGAEMTATRGGPYAQGRWCNGPAWVEYLSEQLGVPYDPDHNRAEGGANSAGILNQVTALPVPDNASTALFVVMPAILDLGSNAGSAANVGFWQRLVDQLMNNTATMIERLHLKGARRIVLVNAPDLGRFPQMAPLDSATRSALRLRIEEHNLALRLRAQNAITAFPGLDVRVAGFFLSFDVIFEQAAAFGFTKTTVAAWHDDELTDKSYAGPGANYLFWDNVHPTSQFHALMARGIANDLIPARLEISATASGPKLSFRDLRLGRDYCVERSSDLVGWTKGDCFQATDFNREYSPDLLPAPASFYRIVPGP